MTFKLPPYLYSPRQIDSFLFDLEAYLVRLRERSAQTTAGVTELDRAPLAQELRNFLNEFTKGQSEEPAAVEQAIIWLRAVKNAPLVHVVLPTFASSAIQQQIVAWFREEIRDDTLVAFTVDTSLLGGILVRTTNGIYDYSFVNRLIAERQRFPEIVRHV